VYSVQCVVYSVQCVVYSVQCTVCSVQYVVYSVPVYTVHWYTVHSTLYTVHWYTVHCAVYTGTLYTVHCTSHQIILVAEIGRWVNRIKLLISCLQNLVFYFDLVGVGRSPKGACRPRLNEGLASRILNSGTRRSATGPGRFIPQGKEQKAQPASGTVRKIVSSPKDIELQ